MPATILNQPAAEPTEKTVGYKQQAPFGQKPLGRDYLLFYIGIPVSLGILFSLIGTRLTYGMPYLDALLYMIVHMFIAWWTVNLGAIIIKACFRSWQPPTIVVCVIGLIVAIIPAAFLFQTVGDFFAGIYPVFATNRYDAIQPSWSLEYLLHFVRYSAPVVPTFLAGVYGYRAATGIDWYGYGNTATNIANLTTTTPPGETILATAQLIAGTKLPADARLMAIKAEQHYIHIWSDQGNDMVRYRFSDLADTLRNCHGTQVHRSWWVNTDFVQSHQQNGRKLDLIINDDLMVPVSLSYKNAVLGLLNKDC
jgi:hypothetical protein